MTREELLRAVAEAAPKEWDWSLYYPCKQDVTTHLEEDPSLPPVGISDSPAWWEDSVLHLIDDVDDAPAMMLMLKEMEKAGWEPGVETILSGKKYRCEVFHGNPCYGGQTVIARGETYAWAVAEAFVAVMQTCKTEAKP